MTRPFLPEAPAGATFDDPAGCADDGAMLAWETTPVGESGPRGSSNRRGGPRGGGPPGGPPA